MQFLTVAAPAAGAAPPSPLLRFNKLSAAQRWARKVVSTTLSTTDVLMQPPYRHGHVCMS
eukprot:365573-Chlamydomonas_euryale.AAC.16